MKVLLFLALIYLAARLHAQDAPLPCNIGQLSIATSAPRGILRLGRLDVTLILRNVSADSCSVPPMPTFTFDDADEQPLDLLGTFQGVRGGYPVQPNLPLTLAPNTQLTSLLAWGTPHPINQDNCLHTVTLTYHLGPETRSIPFEATFCGQPKPHYTFTRLEPSPTPSR